MTKDAKSPVSNSQVSVSQVAASHVPVTDLTESTLFKGFLTIREMAFRYELFDGTQSEKVTRLLMERGTAAAILPYDPIRDEVLLIRQFLIGAHAAGVNNRPLQVVAGMVEPGETAVDVARREVEEEGGITVSRLVPALAFLPSPGGSSERIETFVGEADLSQAGGIFGLAEEHEDIRAEVVPAEEAIRLLDEGHIEAGPAVVVLSWFARNHARLRAEWR